MIKNYKKITGIIISFTLFQTLIVNAFFDDNFEKDFIAKINSLDQAPKSPTSKLHSRSFENAPNHIKMNSQQCSTEFYQQNTSSLTLTNKDKTVKITEKKDNEKTICTIQVIDNTPQQHLISKSENQDDAHLTELKKLQKYIKKSFSSRPAITTLQECIDAINKENKIELLTDGNQTTYTIKIVNKKEVTQTKHSKKKRQRKK